ncbi:hypothetical protein GCM10008174_29010 [Methylopila turkensis]|uniref:Uncharacterized protein n=1 Tax=Methylopila turkensis TaxID=1437816 RepID=A0A9W6N869_9HYPH|nr:hypothetical protein GCM10008174_29010 [Methylopila turkensis]
MGHARNHGGGRIVGVRVRSHLRGLLERRAGGAGEPAGGILLLFEVEIDRFAFKGAGAPPLETCRRDAISG